MTLTPAEFDALQHPLRRRILQAFLDQGLANVSTRELADLLEEPQRQIKYHLTVISKSELLRASEEVEPLWSLNVEPAQLKKKLNTLGPG